MVILACATITTTDLVGATTTPGYDLLRDTVSNQMRPDAGYANILRGALIAYGVLMIPFAFRVRSHFQITQWWKVLFVAGVWMHILSVLAAAVFQNDSNVSIFGIATVNTIHDIGTIVLFTAAVLTLLSASFSSGSMPRWSQQSMHSRISMVMVACMISVFMVAILTDLNGITERVNFAVVMGWMTMTAFTKNVFRSEDS